MLPGMQAPTAQHPYPGRQRLAAAACAHGRPNGLGAPAQGGALVVGIVKVPLQGAPNSTLGQRP